jgi:hypothetical protein
MLAEKSPEVGDPGATDQSANVHSSIASESPQIQVKFEPLRLATAQQFFEKRARGLTGIDEADRWIFEGHLTASTWIPICDALLEPALVQHLESVRACARAAIAEHFAREELQPEISGFHQRTSRVWANRQGGFSSVG